MVKNEIEMVADTKCGNASDDSIVLFERNVYIVRDNGDFVRRKLYGCNKCENLFTYDATPRKESKNIKISENPPNPQNPRAIFSPQKSNRTRMTQI